MKIFFVGIFLIILSSLLFTNSFNLLKEVFLFLQFFGIATCIFAMIKQKLLYEEELKYRTRYSSKDENESIDKILGNKVVIY